MKAHNSKTHLCIEKGTCRVSESDTMPSTTGMTTIFGVLGIVNIFHRNYLVVITGRQRIGRIMDANIYTITNAEFVSLTVRLVSLKFSARNRLATKASRTTFRCLRSSSLLASISLTTMIWRQAANVFLCLSSNLFRISRFQPLPIHATSGTTTSAKIFWRTALTPPGSCPSSKAMSATRNSLCRERR